MKLSNGVKVYCKSVGKVFRVYHIARSDDAANEFCAKHKDCGVIAVDKSGLVYIAELYSLTVKSDVLPD
jgi:hypothetical protein